MASLCLEVMLADPASTHTMVLTTEPTSNGSTRLVRQPGNSKSHVVRQPGKFSSMVGELTAGLVMESDK